MKGIDRKKVFEFLLENADVFGVMVNARMVGVVLPDELKSSEHMTMLEIRRPLPPVTKSFVPWASVAGMGMPDVEFRWSDADPKIEAVTKPLLQVVHS